MSEHCDGKQNVSHLKNFIRTHGAIKLYFGHKQLL